MAFTGNDDGIAFLCLSQRSADRLTPVGDNGMPRPFHSFFDFVDDRHRIFAARIVRRDDRDVALTRRDFAHYGPFGAIAVTAAPEYDDEPAGRDFPGGLQHSVESVVGVRIVDNHA